MPALDIALKLTQPLSVTIVVITVNGLPIVLKPPPIARMSAFRA
jgi:hypothetical protein